MRAVSLNGWSRRLVTIAILCAIALPLFLMGVTVKTPTLTPITTADQVYWDLVRDGIDFKLDVGGAEAAPLPGVGPGAIEAHWTFTTYWVNYNYDTWAGVRVTGDCCAGADITAIVQNQCNGAVYYGSTQQMFTSWWGEVEDKWFADATGGYCYRVIGWAFAGEHSQRPIGYMQGGY